MFLDGIPTWNSHWRRGRSLPASQTCSLLLQGRPPGLSKHIGGCVGSRVTGTARRANGNVPEQSVCQSNIYQSNHILQALEDFAGPGSPTLRPFIKGGLRLLSRIPPAPSSGDSPDTHSAMTWHLMVKAFAPTSSGPKSKQLFKCPRWADSSQTAGQTSGRTTLPSRMWCQRMPAFSSLGAPCPVIQKGFF